MPLYTPIYSDTRDGGHAEILETKETYVGKVLKPTKKMVITILIFMQLFGMTNKLLVYK